MGATNRSSENKVYYTLGTQFGEKEGRPLFKQWLKHKPPTPPNNFEEVNGKYYLTFTDIQGTVSMLKAEDKELTYNGKTEVVKRLYVVMEDKEEKMVIEMGNLDGRYAMNLLARLINPAMDISKNISISPYRISEDEKLNMGVVTYQDGVKIMAMKREELEAMGCNPAVVTEFKGKKFYDFMPPASWMLARVEDKIINDYFAKAPASEHIEEESPIINKQAQAEALYGKPEPKKETQVKDDDDLPF